MTKTSQPKRLDDIAHIFKGVGHRDLFEGKRTKEAPKDALDCRVVHAKDLSQGRLWFDPRSTGKASARIFDKPIRGLGQIAVLRAGDILISTKGRPLTSPVLTMDMIGGMPLVAAAELLVIRPMSGIGRTLSPAHIRNLLEHPESALYLQKHSSINPLNRSLFFSKETLGGLPISKMREDSIPFLEESNEQKAFAAETSTGKLHRILKAIMRAGSRRLNQQPPCIRTPRIDESGLSWHGSGNRYSLEREPEAAQKVSEALSDFAKSKLSSKDSELLSQRLCELAKAKDPAAALLSDREAFEALTLLVHGGDQACSTTHTNHSIREILGQCATSVRDVAVEGAEAGHTALEVAKAAKNAKSVTLLEAHADYRKIAAAAARLALPKSEVLEHENIFHVKGDRLYDLVVFEAAARTFAAAEKRNDDLGVAGLFNWNGYMTKLRPGALMIIHVPTDGWKRLTTIRSHIKAIIQTPPTVRPEKFALKNQYTPCSQGLLVAVSAEGNQTDKVRVINATMAVDNGKPTAALPRSVIKGLANMAMGESENLPNVFETLVNRDELFGKYPKAWPGILTLLNKLPDDETLSTCCTLETLLEEYRFHENERQERTKEIFSGMGIRD